MSNPPEPMRRVSPTVPLPAVGRIVHVPTDPAMNNGQHYAPAIITTVWNAASINVRVLPDSDAIERRTSVTYVPSLADVADDPNRLNRWTWPPRV